MSSWGSKNWKLNIHKCPVLFQAISAPTKTRCRCEVGEFTQAVKQFNFSAIGFQRPGGSFWKTAERKMTFMDLLWFACRYWFKLIFTRLIYCITVLLKYRFIKVYDVFTFSGIFAMGSWFLQVKMENALTFNMLLIPYVELCSSSLCICIFTVILYTMCLVVSVSVLPFNWHLKQNETHIACRRRHARSEAASKTKHWSRQLGAPISKRFVFSNTQNI